MKLINTDNQLLKKYYDMGKTLLYLRTVPYKNNTCIKLYTEDNEPIGDIEEIFVSQYLEKSSVVMFINETINDETGMLEYTVTTII